MGLPAINTKNDDNATPNQQESQNLLSSPEELNRRQQEFLRLLAEHRESLFRYARSTMARFGIDASEAEDVVQEFALRALALQGSHPFDPTRASFSTYAKRFLKNIAREFLRKRKVRRSLPSDFEHEDTGLSFIELVDAQDFIETLNPEEQELIRWAAFGEASEFVSSLSKSVRSCRLCRARDRLWNKVYGGSRIKRSPPEDVG